MCWLCLTCPTHFYFFNSLFCFLFVFSFIIYRIFIYLNCFKMTKCYKKLKKQKAKDNSPEIQWIVSETEVPNALRKRKRKGQVEPVSEHVHDDIHRNSFDIFRHKKAKMSNKQIKMAATIRRARQDKFLKMLFTAQTKITPWTDLDECKEVHECIYSSLHVEMKDFAESSDYGKQVTIEASKIDSLYFARDKLSTWRLRCRNIPRSAIVTSHLISIESILDVLIEQHRFNQSSVDDHNAPNSSILYSLYSVCVINFCNALSSYSSDFQIDISVRNLAQLLECPEWIVSCRHALSHPNENRPTLAILGEAIAFSLEWMDRFFWTKAICGQFNFSKTPKASPPSLPLMSNIGTSREQSKPLEPDEERIFNDTCLLLFTICANNRAAIKRKIRDFFTRDPNRYIRLFAEILVFGVPIHQPIQLDQYSLPTLLRRRSSRIFAMIFAALPADQMLILLLNQLVDQTEHAENLFSAQRFSPSLKYHEQSIHCGRCWLWAIIEAITYNSCAENANQLTIDQNDQCESSPKISPEPDRLRRRQTVFDRSFDVFADFAALKRRHSFTWIRLFYRLAKLRPHENSRRLLSQFYQYLIDEDVISVDAFASILGLIDISISRNRMVDNKDGDKFDKQPMHTVQQLQERLKSNISLGPIRINAWKLPLGSSLRHDSSVAISASNDCLRMNIELNDSSSA